MYRTGQLKPDVKLWQHQTAMISFMESRPGVLIAGDMGTGKTLASLAYAMRFKRILVFVNTEVSADVWIKQISDRLENVAVLNLVTKRLSTNKRLEKLRDFRSALTQIVITNYQGFWRYPLIQGLVDYQPDIIILDESHKIQAHNSTSSKTLWKVFSSVPHKVLLTGTPMPSGPEDLYGQFRFIDPQVFGTNYHQFRERYCILAPIPGTPHIYKIVGYRNQDEFNKRIQPYMYRLKIDDVFDMPEVTHTVIPVELDKGARTVYNQMKRDFITTLENGEILVADNVLVQGTRLQQIANGHVKGHLVSRAKTEAVLSLVGKLDINEPLTIFVQHTSDITSLYLELIERGYTVSVLMGGTNELADWQAGKTQIILVQNDTGSESIDLTRSHYLAFYSMSFDAGKYEQALARIRRPGQVSKTVHYYHIQAVNTIDERIYKAVINKQSIYQAVLDELRGFNNE